MCPALLQFWYNVIHCKSAYKTDYTVICVPCMLEHVCYEPFSSRTLQIWKISYVNWLKFVCCLKFMSLKKGFKQTNENLKPNVYARSSSSKNLFIVGYIQIHKKIEYLQQIWYIGRKDSLRRTNLNKHVKFTSISYICGTYSLSHSRS